MSASRSDRGAPLPIRQGSGEGLCTPAFEDLAAIQEAARALRESEARYRRIVETAEEGILIVDIDNRLSFVNARMAGMLGYEVAELVGQPAFIVMDEAGRQEVEPRLRNRRRGMREQYEFRFRRKDGSDLWGRVSASPITDDAGAYLGALAMVTDITEYRERERRRREEEIAHRNILVREVHHRIKNSLQGVTGLLRQFAVGHPEAAPALAEAAAMVQSVAVIHGLQGRALSAGVTLCGLAESVAAGVGTLMQARIVQDIPPHSDACLHLTEQDAVPLALVLNELMVNAVKHGRPGKVLRLELDMDPAAASAEIRIGNAGGLPPGFDSASSRKMLGSGLQLVSALLPTEGAHLSWCETGGWVWASLRLESPVIAVLRGSQALVVSDSM